MALIILLVFSACSAAPPSEEASGHIYLYGEAHGDEVMLNEELELWRDYYINDNMRHLFIEADYYIAEYLNLWMQSDSDEIFDEIFADWSDTLANNPNTKKLYKSIKSECPETIFHGIDVGLFHSTSGKRYLEYLEANGLEDSEQYLLAQETIEQGKAFRSDNTLENCDNLYRENKLAENFIREFDKLDGESVMGIFGAAHTGLDALDFTGHIPCMGAQLRERYGDAVQAYGHNMLLQEPIRFDNLTIGEKEYTAAYYGTKRLHFNDEYNFMEIWRLEDAYDDFKDMQIVECKFPYRDFPMHVDEGQIFVIDFTKDDDSVVREYHRSDGDYFDSMPATTEFLIG